MSDNYRILELSSEWIEQASALNRLNIYMFNHGVYGPDRKAPPQCTSQEMLFELNRRHLFGFSAICSNKLVGAVTCSPIPDPALDMGFTRLFQIFGLIRNIVAISLANVKGHQRKRILIFPV